MPRVSIVIPVFNDEESIARALESCIRQTLDDIEIICVDDASDDGSVGVIDRYVERDSRVRLIRQPENLSAFQARRQGILAATAPYILFLDGDDELDPNAAAKTVTAADKSGADLVGFGSVIVRADGKTGGAFEKRLQPKSSSLDGAEVLRGIFPVGQPASGQLWRYLFSSEILREAYGKLPDDLVLRRANDVPIMFLVATLARSYASVSDRLYRYSFGAGGSGQAVTDPDQVGFYASAISSIDSIRAAVRLTAWSHLDPGLVLDAYENVRRSIIGNTLAYLVRRSDDSLITHAIDEIHSRAPRSEVLSAAAEFAPDAVEVLKSRSARIEAGARPVKSVLLTTMTLRTGGVTGVLLAQARFLMEAGYRVTIVAKRPGSDRALVPDGAAFVETVGDTLPQRLAEWAELCRIYEIDLVIDHQILYTRDWPEYALAARGEGVPTIGWIHNFAARPVFDLKNIHSLMQRNMHMLANLVVLSELDVAFWKLRGVPHALYLPNPPSPKLIESSHSEHWKTAPTGRTLELVWWGRLEQRTKRVLSFIDVAEQLVKTGIDFNLTIIGPEWGDLTADRFNATARKRGVGDVVKAVGPRYGQDLTDAIDAADAFVNVSVIEGYPLTLPEAQARGLPVFMYDMPWLALVQDNDGIVAVPQGDAAALAAEIAGAAQNAERYEQLSEGSLQAGRRSMSYDFGALYTDLVEGKLSPEFSPEPTMEDASELLDLLIFFSEQNTGLVKRK